MEEMMKESFSSRIRQLLDIKGWKQADLAKNSGVSKSSISHYLRGDWEAKQDIVYKIAKSANVDESWLMGYDVPMERVKKAADTTVSGLVETNYDLLSPAHKAAVDLLIQQLYNAQSNE